MDWNVINSSMFEKMAYEYVSNKFTGIKWEPTKHTKDGNKDGEANFMAPMKTTIKYWYEAKYSKSIDKSIPKSHLDSTLVSCLLDGKVVYIAFITNAYISEDYRRRADVFAKQRDNLKIIYINGDEIEEWLYNNPEVEMRYFMKNTNKKVELKEKLKSVCILQNFNFHGEQFTKVKSVECGKEYVLYVSYYSTQLQNIVIKSQTNSISFLESYNRNYDQHNELNCSIGNNSFYIPIKINYDNGEKLLFELISYNNSMVFEIENVKIIDIYNPVIVYGSQIEIQNRLFAIINDRDISNAVFGIVGDAGTGKSYLLNNIYQNGHNPFSSYVISFTGDENTDTLLCYKIILLSLYGDIWEYIYDTNDIKQLNTIEISMIQQIKNNDVDIKRNFVEQVMLFYQKNNSFYEKHIDQKQIYIDDYHKLSSQNANLITEFLKWFIKQRFNCKVFIFSRPERELPICNTKFFKIKNITPNDVEATILKNWKNIKKLPSLIKKYPVPLNALHFLNLLCQLHLEEKNLINKTPLEMQLILNNIYENSTETTCLSLGKQIISKYLQSSIVYCVYKIKTGISLSVIISFFGEKSYSEIYDLYQNRILKESSERLFPYHDIMISAFESVKIDEQDLILEEFVLFAQRNNYISKSKMFSVLIGIGQKCFIKYKKEACEFRDKLHESADYYLALEIAQKIKESYNKNLNDYNKDDCQNQFIIANCVKHTDSYEKANIEFRKVKDIYELTRNPDLYGFYLEAETEIINNLIWMLDVKEAKRRLLALSSSIETLYLHNRIQGRNLIYAFLNYYNRLMFVNFMLDDDSQKDFDDAIKFSKELKREEYEGFAKMDYAKSLYGKNLVLAKELLSESLTILVRNNEKRRVLDAKSELQFIDDINNGKFSYNSYQYLMCEMKKHCYIQSETKIQLKMIVLKLLYSGNTPSEIRSEIDAISVNNTTIASGKRHQAFINHLYAACYYKEGNIVETKKFSLKCLKLMASMGSSYKNVHLHNHGISKVVGILTINQIDDWNDMGDEFVLDIRLW